MPRRRVVTYHLEMLDPARLVSSTADPGAELALVRARRPLPELGRFLYQAVGGDWYWIDRLPWSRERWHRRLSRREVELWVLNEDGVPAGYFELEIQPAERSVEIVYFGLLPAHTGRGIGGFLLTRAVERAWSLGQPRVWVHTCTLDHPAALSNYRARGFTLFKETVTFVDLPQRPPTLWG